MNEELNNAFIMKLLFHLVIIISLISCESSLCDSRREIFPPEVQGLIIKKCLKKNPGEREMSHVIIKNYTDSIYDIEWTAGYERYIPLNEGDSVYKPKRSLHLTVYRKGEMVIGDYNLDVGCSSLYR
ncbi:MAG TPA: hypothetical protein VNW06_04895 [Cytophagaceae bacterium]|jgi:hypothetical protein|nr:hypothetical protein [Cytophagaceae bacterium]